MSCCFGVKSFGGKLSLEAAACLEVRDNTKLNKAGTFWWRNCHGVVRPPTMMKLGEREALVDIGVPRFYTTKH